MKILKPLMPKYILRIIYGKFIGTLINNKKEGNGKYIYNNGHKYEGEYKNNLRDGRGIYYIILVELNKSVNREQIERMEKE